jgi:hypothetical protein
MRVVVFMANEGDSDPIIEVRPISLSDVIEVANALCVTPAELWNLGDLEDGGAAEPLGDDINVSPEVQRAILNILRAVSKPRKRSALESPDSRRTTSGDNGAGGNV